MENNYKIKYIPMSVIFVLIGVMFLLTITTCTMAYYYDKIDIVLTNKAIRNDYDNILINTIFDLRKDYNSNESFYDDLLKSGTILENGHVNIAKLLNSSSFLSYGVGSNKKDEYILTKDFKFKYYDEYLNETVVEDFQIVFNDLDNQLNTVNDSSIQLQEE